jgi:ectoine hydroxylase-related dioxygenase (phytanoyl-CoA dioxygenase family)
MVNNPAMRTVKTVLRPVLDATTLCGAGLWYAVGGSSMPSAYQAMIRMFCRTGGSSNDFMSQCVRLFDRGATLPAPRGDLGVASQAEAARIGDRLRSDGYYVFDQCLSADVCERLLAAALRVPASVRPMAGAVRGPKRLEVYDRSQPLAVRYDFAAEEVLNLADVQDLMSNPTILSVAQNYLQTTPIADVVSMWWHTGFSHQPDEEAAQFFHFDMDRIKWLKFFIYLTDVGPESGAHCFVKGSHRTGAIPRELLSSGYARLTDDQVLRHYSADRIIEFHGRRGTVIAEDTRGLHKGREVLSGDRLMLQIQFSSSLFGGFYPRAFFRSMGAGLERMVKAHPRIYKNYLRDHRG